MNRATAARPGVVGETGRFRLGMKGLMGAVASCALIFWAGLSIRDYLKGNSPLRQIRSGDAIERRTAAQQLSLDQGIPAEAAMAALVLTLRDEEAEVRAIAAQSLGLFLSKMRDHPTTPPVSRDRLKGWIDLATPGMVALLSDGDPGVRAAAAIGLGMMARGLSSVPPRLNQETAMRANPAMTDRSNAVRREAAKQFYGLPDVTLMPELVSALEDESAGVRAAAARALWSFGPDLDREVPALIAMTESEETSVRMACVEALEAAWPATELAPILIGALRSRHREVRDRAAQLLGRIGPESSPAISALISVLKEPSGGSYPDLAPAAARALGHMGPKPEVITALVAEISPEKVEANLAAWGKIRPDAAAGRVPVDASLQAELRVLSERASRITSAIRALGEIGPPAIAAVPNLIASYHKTLGSNQYHVGQSEIVEALGRIAPNSAAVPDIVAALIRDLDANDSWIRLAAVKALAAFGKDASAAIPKIRAIQEDYDRSIRAAAAAANSETDTRARSRLAYSDAVNRRERDAVAKSLAALEAGSKPDAGGERSGRSP